MLAKKDQACTMAETPVIRTSDCEFPWRRVRLLLDRLIDQVDDPFSERNFPVQAPLHDGVI